MAVLLLQLLFSAQLVLGSEAASSPVIGNAVTAVIDNPCESFAKRSVCKVRSERSPGSEVWGCVLFASLVLEPRAAFICIAASINHLTPLQSLPRTTENSFFWRKAVPLCT